MTHAQILKVWLSILLTPLVPVVVLYVLFSRLNYFETTGALKGVIATGPIAAYMVAVVVGERIYRNLVGLSPVLDARLDAIIGDWEVESTSTHGTIYRGRSRFTSRDGGFYATGSLESAGRTIGQWVSLAVVATPSGQLIILYEMTEMKEGKEKRSRGVNEVGLSPDGLSPMVGTWTALGVNDNAGTITYRRPSSSGPARSPDPEAVDGRAASSL